MKRYLKLTAAMVITAIGLSACALGAAPFAVQAGMGAIGGTMGAAAVGEAVCAGAENPEACKGNE